MSRPAWLNWIPTLREKPKSAPRRRPVRSHFAGAAVDRLVNGWSTSVTRHDKAIREDLRELRARSRDLIRNNEHAARAVQMKCDNIVGPNGFQLQSQPRNQKGEIDRVAAAAIEESWKRWCHAEHCDMRRQLSFVDMCRQVVSSKFGDGEALVRIFEGPVAGEPFGFALQILDPELLDVTYNEQLAGGYFIRAGIEYDPYGRAVAYHIRRMSDSRTDDLFYASRDYQRIDAKDIMLLYRPLFPEQTRGIPEMAAGMISLKHLAGLREAAIVNHRAAASKMGFIYSEDGDQDEGEDTDADGNPIDEFDPLTITELDAGKKFESFDPSYPAGEFQLIDKSILRAFYSSVGLSYASSANDLENVNYSALKTGKDDERNGYSAEQIWEAEHFCRPVFERWVFRQVMQGTIRIGNTPLRADRFEKYLSASFTAHSWPDLDPLKSANSEKVRLENRTRSRSEIIRKSGRDPEEVWGELGQDDRDMERLGVPATADATPMNNTEPPKPEEDDDA